jgi:hypothetical protein
MWLKPKQSGITYNGKAALWHLLLNTPSPTEEGSLHVLADSSGRYFLLPSPMLVLVFLQSSSTTPPTPIAKMLRDMGMSRSRSHPWPDKTIQYPDFLIFRLELFFPRIL